MIKQIAETLCSHTGWKMPLPDKKNKICFLLEHDAQLTLFSPNGQDCIFIVTLSPLPHDSQKNEYIQNVAQKAGGMYKKRKSVLSLTDGNVTLHRILKQPELTKENILQTAKDILNDADIWHTVLSGNKNRTSPFSFSFTGSNF